MDFSSLNWVAIIVVTLIHFILGMLWYSPALMGTKWMALMGKRKEDFKKEDAQKAMFGSLISNFIVSIILAALVMALNPIGFGAGAMIGFWVWLGFIATSSMTAVLYENKKIGLYHIYNGYEFISYIVMAGVLAIW